MVLFEIGSGLGLRVRRLWKGNEVFLHSSTRYLVPPPRRSCLGIATCSPSPEKPNLQSRPNRGIDVLTRGLSRGKEKTDEFRIDRNERRRGKSRAARHRECPTCPTRRARCGYEASGARQGPTR